MITVDYLQSIFSKLPPELLPIPGWFIATSSCTYSLPFATPLVRKSAPELFI